VVPAVLASGVRRAGALRALLVAGLLGGELAHRLAGLPRVMGYVLAGVACGRTGSG
jgi:Kef-type K+ transport system membrane component KefB